MNACAHLKGLVAFFDRLVRFFRCLAMLAFRSVLVLTVATGAGLAIWELRTSTLQASFFARQADRMTFEAAPGPSDTVRFPRPGPFDIRRGYSLLPEFIGRLTEAGYRVTAQTRFSAPLVRATELGLSPPYREKPQAGLRIVDRDGRTVFDRRYPRIVYDDFTEVPPIVVSTLLYIENRELLNDRYPKRNPTVEWDRLAFAAASFLRGDGDGDGNAAGGSTLATQIEKIRHSPGGLTASAGEKLRQMVSASLRVYGEGEKTATERRRLVVDYLNSLPLAAVSGHGEVIGLADGLRCWYGADFRDVNRTLHQGLGLPEAARSYKRVLSLLIAQRRPQHFLIDEPEALESLADSYLRMLARDGVIPHALRDAALAIPLRPARHRVIPSPEEDWVSEAADIVRAPLVARLSLPGYYQLDRLDLTVHSSIDRAAQARVAKILRRLGDPQVVRTLGLTGSHMLGNGDYLDEVEYSFTLYERGDGVNWLRLQASSIDRPFNLSDGARLDLGSTAKLRTVANYLQIMASLHERLAGDGRAAVRRSGLLPGDPLTRWAAARLNAAPNLPLDAFLDEALDRQYSASPAESFFTGGGLHRFSNFDHDDDHRRLTLRESFRRSVNLVFVRLMRDIVRYYRARLPDYAPEIFTDVDDPRRRLYLERFVHYDGKARLAGFYRAYAGKSPDQALALLADRARGSPRRVAAILRYVAAGLSPEEFAIALRRYAAKPELTPETVERLYGAVSPDLFDLQDMGYLARLHPLELWIARYLTENPAATLADVLRDSAAARLEAYRWLFNSRSRHAQNLRIRIMLEREAFKKIERDWQALGYPFGLVPSLATALGTSADRPASLGELVGIIVNDGVRQPDRRITGLHFAEGTPYETVLKPASGGRAQVLEPEVARAVRRLMVETVEHGTARRASGVLVRKDGTAIAVGGKTGTGDHRYKVFGRGGRLVSERVVSRSATFVFLIGDRFYGVVTAHVMGEAAAHHSFTSALAVQLFASLAPQILPVIDDTGTVLVEAPSPPPAESDEPQAMPPVVVEPPQTAPGAPPPLSGEPAGPEALRTTG